MNSVIKVENLKKSYGNIVAVDEISLVVEKGQCFGLLGQNGGGKTTTIECILGLKDFENGKVEILGLNPKVDRKKLFQKVSVQLQNSFYQSKIKVYELCEEISVLYDEVDDFKKLLKDFGLMEKKNNYVETLSGGEKQKLSIVLALIPKPEVIFLDELTTGLDVEARHEVWNRLKELKKLGITIFMVSHFMDEVTELCDKISIIKGGKELIADTVEGVVKSTPCNTLEEAYLWYIKEEK